MTFFKAVAFGIATSSATLGLATSASAIDWQLHATQQLGYAQVAGLESANSAMVAQQAQNSARDAMAPLLGQLTYPYTNHSGVVWTYMMVSRYNSLVSAAASSMRLGSSLFNTATSFNVQAINEISEGDVNFQQGLYYHANTCYYNATYKYNGARDTFNMAKTEFDAAKSSASSANAMDP